MLQVLSKPLIYLGVLSIVVAVSFFYGCTYTETKFKAAEAIQAEENAKKMAQIVAKTEEETRKHYERYIKVLKNIHKLPDTCQLSADFRMLHDEAAGVSSGPTTQTVAVATVAETVAKNYSNCQQNAIWLDECNSICSP